MELNSEGIQLNIIYVWITLPQVISLQVSIPMTRGHRMSSSATCSEKIKNKIHIDNREV